MRYGVRRGAKPLWREAEGVPQNTDPPSPGGVGPSARGIRAFPAGTTDVMTSTTTTETRNQIVRLVRDFVKREVEPVAAEHDREDTYPAELVESMNQDD